MVFREKKSGQKRIVRMIIFFMFFSMVPLAAKELYVHSLKAPVFEKAQLGTAVLGELFRGEVITDFKKVMGFYRIEHKGKRGYVYGFMVKSTPPYDPVVPGEELMDEFKSRARKRPSSFSTTAAARGFRKKRNQLGKNLALDYQGVDRLESFVKSERQALEFISELEE